jgi:hypothetical protein
LFILALSILLLISVEIYFSKFILYINVNHLSFLAHTKKVVPVEKVNTLVNWGDKRRNEPSRLMFEFLNNKTDKYITSSFAWGCGRLGNMVNFCTIF